MSEKEWRFRYLLREVIGNVVSGGWRTLLLAAILIAVMSSAALFEAISVSSILDRDINLIERGRYVVRITPGSDSPEAIDAAACDRLALQGGVVSSGAILRTGLFEVSSTPGVRARRISITPGLLAALDLGDPVSSVVVGAELAEELDVIAGSVMRMVVDGSPETLIVDEVMSGSSSRFPEANRAVLVANAPLGDAADCYVEIYPTVFDEYRVGVAALESLTSVAPNVSRLVSVEEGEAPGDRYAHRPSRFAALAAAAILCSIAAISLQARRSEIGVYRATGTSKSAVFIILFGEFVTLIAGAAVISASGLVLVSAKAGMFTEPVRHGYSMLIVASALTMAGTAIVTWMVSMRIDVLQALKDR